MKYTSKLGFTLAELLAVVIIVAILSGLSLGYYKRAVEDSRFGEGLGAAGTLVEAVNQSYFDQKLDNPYGTPTVRPKVKTLDINLANSTPSNEKPYSLSTPRFEVRVETDGSVRAYRGNATTYKYYIQINPDFVSNPGQISCVGKDDKGKTFCESMGYTSCSSGYKCTKPKLTAS